MSDVETKGEDADLKNPHVKFDVPPDHADGKHEVLTLPGDEPPPPADDDADRPPERDVAKPRPVISRFAETRAKLATPADVASYVTEHANDASMKRPKELATFLQFLANRPADFYTSLFAEQKGVVCLLMERAVQTKLKSEFVCDFFLRAVRCGADAAEWLSSATAPNGTTLPVLTVAELVADARERDPLGFVTREVALCSGADDLRVAATTLNDASIVKGLSHGDQTKLIGSLLSKARRILFPSVADDSADGEGGDGAEMPTPAVGKKKPRATAFVFVQPSDAERGTAIESLLTLCDEAVVRRSVPPPAKLTHFVAFLAVQGAVPESMQATVGALTEAIATNATSQATGMTAVLELKSCATLAEVSTAIDSITDSGAGAQLRGDSLGVDVLSGIATAALRVAPMPMKKKKHVGPDAASDDEADKTVPPPLSQEALALQAKAAALLSRAVAAQGATLPRRAAQFVESVRLRDASPKAQ